MNKHIQKIKDDIVKRCYSLKKVTESEKNLLRIKRVKFLLKKVQKSKGKSTKDQMLLLFKLGKELEENSVK